MKTCFLFFGKPVFIITIITTLGLSTAFAQSSEITEKDKTEQESVLEKDPKNYAALFVVGAYYYNLAVEPHQKASSMKVTDYLTKGEPLEKQKESYLQKALPYFENAYAVAEDKNRMKEILKGVYQQLGKIPSARVTDSQINQNLEEILSELNLKRSRVMTKSIEDFVV